MRAAGLSMLLGVLLPVLVLLSVELWRELRRPGPPSNRRRSRREGTNHDA